MFMSKFSEKLAEGLAGQWTAQTFGPAFVFWAGGVMAWTYQNGWNALESRLSAFTSTPACIALAIGGVLLIAISGTMMQWLQTPAIRWAEGYWPRPFHWLRPLLARRLKRRLNSKEERWDELANIPEENRSTEQHAELIHLDTLLSRYPIDERLLMPTSVGNLLRAAEEYPYVRYGLDAIVCWPRMWLLMPAETLESLSEAREQLSACARVMLWSIIFPVWTLWADWAALSLLIFPMAYLKMVSAADTYGALIRAAFDLHRFKLYEALKWPLPPGPEEEAEWGKELNNYLSHGTAPDRPVSFRGENQTPAPHIQQQE